MHCWWECTLVQPPWKTVCSFLKQLKIQLPYDPTIPLCSIYLKNNENNISKRYLHPYAHCSIFYNSQDMETT